MFCVKCGNRVSTKAVFCVKCGNAIRKRSVQSYNFVNSFLINTITAFNNPAAALNNKFNLKIITCSFILCLTFFLSPLISISGRQAGGRFMPLPGMGFDLSFTATGFQLASGRHQEVSVEFLGMGFGDYVPNDPMPPMFIFLILPALLFFLSLTSKPMKYLLITVSANLVFHILFMLIMFVVSAQFRALRILGISMGMTGFAWFILIINILLIYFIRNEIKLSRTNSI